MLVSRPTLHVRERAAAMSALPTEEYMALPGDDAEESAVDPPSAEEASLRARVAALNAKVRQDPTDVDAWIALVEVQELTPDGSGSEGGKKRHARSGAAAARLAMERQMAILERAQGHLPENEVLALGFMRLAGLVWESARVLNAWDSVLRRCKTSFAVKRAYVDYRMSQFATFTVDECGAILLLELYVCLSFTGLVATIVSLLRQLETFRDEAPMEGRMAVEEQMVYMIARASRLYIDAGAYAGLFVCMLT